MKGRLSITVVILVTLLTILGWSFHKLRGPSLPGYEITAGPLVQAVVATGRVAALSRTEVGSEITGVVHDRRVREGDLVKPGDVLATLRADDLEASLREAEAQLAEFESSTRPRAEAALQEAQVALEQASRETLRRHELYKQRAISREELERAQQAEAAARASAEQARLIAQSLVPGNASEAQMRARVANARAQLAKTTIRSPVTGTVLTRNAEPGDVVQPSRVLFEIARAGETEILVPFDEKNLEVLAIGQPAMCVADAFPTRPFTATVNFIAPRVDPQRGTVDVRLKVDPDPGMLREDMTVSVNVETGRRDRAIVVPNDALSLTQGNEALVWLVDGGRAERRQVQLGLRGLSQTEVTAGLRLGDWVLADAPATIAEGARVRVHAAATHNGTEGRVDSATRRELPVPME